MQQIFISRIVFDGCFYPCLCFSFHSAMKVGNKMIKTTTTSPIISVRVTSIYCSPFRKYKANNMSTVYNAIPTIAIDQLGWSESIVPKMRAANEIFANSISPGASNSFCRLFKRKRINVSSTSNLKNQRD